MIILMLALFAVDIYMSRKFNKDAEQVEKLINVKMLTGYKQ